MVLQQACHKGGLTAVMPSGGLTDDMPLGGLTVSMPHEWSYSRPATEVVLWQSCHVVDLQTTCR